MTKRLLAALALACFFSSTAFAKLLVVAGEEPVVTNNVIAAHAMTDRINMAVLSTLNQFGVDYKVVSPALAKTDFIRRGVMTWNFGTPSAYNESFDAVLVLNMGARSTSETPWPRSSTGCYPCSTTVGGVTKAPLVPQGWLFGAKSGENIGSDLASARFTNQAGSLPCSTGVAKNGNGAAGAAAFGENSANPHTQYDPATQTSWFSNANTMGFFPDAATSGGVRSLLKNYQAYHYGRYRYTLVESNNADTVEAGLGADTTVIWERPFKNMYAGANNTLPIKPIVFANVMGASPCSDSAGTYLPCEYDPHITLLVLARLDSLTGGKVFSKPKKAAIVLSGAFERNLRRLPGGANDQDSSVIKATLDSLGALGVPLTVGANADSISSYPNEVSWWKKVPAARFSPYTTYGLTDTTKASNWSSTRVVDLFGRYRNRAIVGDSLYHAVAGADSSILAGLVLLRDKIKDAGLRVSGTVVAPLDDWSPKNMLSKSTPLDSLTLAFSRAGFSAVLTDVQRNEASINRTKANRDLVRGYDGVQRDYYNPLLGKEFRLIGHTGYNITGSSMNYMVVPTDSTTIPLTYSFGGTITSTPTASMMSLGRFWYGFLNDNWRDIDWFPTTGIAGYGGYLDIRYPSADLFGEFRRASVMKLHVSDLGGIPNGPPARPGYWAIKSLVNQFRAVNAWANRKVLILTYPEDCEP